MELLLVQHGEARPKEEDPARPLSDRGRRLVEQMAVFAARHGVKVDEIRHSGKLRARQTAAVLAEALEPPKGLREAPGLNPEDDVNDAAESLAHEHGRIMLVGHLPFLGRLAGLLLAGDPDAPVVQFRNAGIVHLVRDEDPEAPWSLRWAVTPDFVG